MIFAFVIGLILGLGAVIYRGLYFGPWDAALATLGFGIVATMVIYVLIRAVIGIGSFFLKILLIAALIAAIVFGSIKVWNRYNPTQPITIFSSSR